jgi:NAD(P)-dependent dehydrogenase (short-subunit alcohol dehydrogenase family)
MTIALDGRTALVTGGGRGIGRAIALELMGAGAAVALVARSRDELEATAERIGELGGTAVVIQADLGDPAQVARTAREATDALGRVDILVNNAGVLWPMRPSAGLDPAEWAAAIDINVVGLAGLTFTLLPGMLKRGWGRVINVSSGVVAAPGAMLGGNAYVTGKAAVEAHTVNLAAELAGTGVTVNAYRPGAVDTEMQTWIRSQDPAETGEAVHAMFTQMHQAGILISSEAAAAALLAHLANEAATGEIWDVTDVV